MTLGLSALLSHEDMAGPRGREPKATSLNPELFLVMVAGCVEQTTPGQPALPAQAPGEAVEAVRGEALLLMQSERPTMATEPAVTASSEAHAIVRAVAPRATRREPTAAPNELPRVVSEGRKDGPERAEPAQRAGTPPPAAARPAGFTQTRTPVQISATPPGPQLLAAGPRPVDPPAAEPLTSGEPGHTGL